MQDVYDTEEATCRMLLDLAVFAHEGDEKIEDEISQGVYDLVLRFAHTVTYFGYL